MLLWILSYLGGLLTILSPCILPVLPFVFSKSGQPFRQSGLPLLLGMILTFTGVALLAVAGGAWVVAANQWGRWIALALMAFFGLSLIFPHLIEVLFTPVTRLGSRLSVPKMNGESGNGFSHSLVLGAATGLLWAPCAGPILGLILTGAASQGGTTQAAGFLFAYALGAATSLMGALAAGGKFFGVMKKTLGAERIVRRVLGTAVLLGVLSVGLNWDRVLLTKLSRFQTEKVEQKLVELFHPKEAGRTLSESSPGRLTDLSRSGTWLNSAGLSAADLKGKVVLIDFWTYSCINCLRTLPYLKAWSEKYADRGLVVIGVHAPEFAFERDEKNVAAAVKELGIKYPVTLDNEFGVWNAFKNEYWPAHYFFDRQGVLRHSHHGEGEYEASEATIRSLLAEDGKPVDGSLASAGVREAVRGAASIEASGATDAASPETYLGYDRGKNLKLTPALREDETETYRAASDLALNEWTVDGAWKFEESSATAVRAHAKIRFHFRARDLHLVLGPGATEKRVLFRVTIDGKSPGKSHGLDTDTAGQGTLTDQRLYQLIRQPEGESGVEHTFEIEFLGPGAQAFAFTFG